VRPEWIDDNGHLNMGYWVAAFDRATTTTKKAGSPDTSWTPGQ